MKDGSRIAGTQEFKILVKNGIRIGLIGLAEFEWICTLNVFDIDDVIYEDYVYAGDKIAKMLRDRFSCEFIIALTHMRNPNDRRLTQKTKLIDLVLGGHDHVIIY